MPAAQRSTYGYCCQHLHASSSAACKLGTRCLCKLPSTVMKTARLPTHPLTANLQQGIETTRNIPCWLDKVISNLRATQHMLLCGAYNLPNSDNRATTSADRIYHFPRPLQTTNHTKQHSRSSSVQSVRRFTRRCDMTRTKSMDVRLASHITCTATQHVAKIQQRSLALRQAHCWHQHALLSRPAAAAPSSRCTSWCELLTGSMV